MPTQNELDFAEIVNNSPVPNTSGYFTELMESVNEYVKGEYNAGRLTGAEYANVYLGAMQSVIAQSVQYAAQKAQSDAQVALLKQQTLTEAVNTDIAGQKLLGETYQVTYMMPAQKALVEAQASVALTEATKVEAEKLLMSARAVSEVSNKAMIDANVSKIAAENLLVAEQVVTESTKRSLIDAQKNDAVANLSVKAAEAAKLISEVRLIDAKSLSEAEQPAVLRATAEFTTAKAATEAVQATSLTAQSALYATQAAAFKGKHLVDILSKMVDGVTMVATSKITNAEIDAAETALFASNTSVSTAASNAAAVTFPA